MKIKQTQGFSLIELMVATVIAVLVLAGVMQIMTNSKRTYTFQQQKARLQESARFAAEFVGHGLRMAGYFGCSQGSLLMPTGEVVPMGAIEALEGVGPNSSDAFMATYMETGRNAFSAVHCPRNPLTGERVPVSCETASGNKIPSPFAAGVVDIPLDSEGYLTTPANVDILVAASDCIKTHVYRLAYFNSSTDIIRLSLPQNTTVSNVGLQAAYDNGGFSPGAEIRQLKSERFYIAEGADGEVGLYRDNGIYRTGTCPSTTSATASPVRSGETADNNPNVFPDIDNKMYENEANPTITNNCYAQELVPDVESMQLRWGQDTDADWVPNIYRRADAVTNWSQVISAEVSFLVRTDERFDREPDTEDYADDLDPVATDMGRIPAAQDHRRRAVFRNVVELRNRTLVK